MKKMRAHWTTGILILATFANIALWSYSNKIYTKWANVPQPPSALATRFLFLADDSFAYRVWAIALQNFGNVGEAKALKDYDFTALGQWFELMNQLDSKSHFMPYLAAYYFGATQDEKQVPIVIAYLEKVGKNGGPDNWRWLAHAAYLARHRLHDMNEALRIAKELGSIYKPPMPIWTRNMEPLLRADMGDRQAAYLLSLEILKSDGEKMSNSEYNSTVYTICHSILKPDEAVKSPICQK